MKKTLAAWIACEVARMETAHENPFGWGFTHQVKVLRDIDENLCALEKILPSGSGFDQGTKILYYKKKEEFVLETEFHHHGEHGYEGWTEHEIVVRPSFEGISLLVKGRNKNEIKDYIQEVFFDALMEVYEQKEPGVFVKVSSDG